MFDWKEIRTGILLAIILGIGGIVWTLIIKYTEDISFKQAWDTIISTDIKLWQAFLLVITIVIISYIILRPKSIAKLQRPLLSNREQLKKFNSLEDDQANILVKWNTYFHHNGKPFIADTTIYCTNHPPVPIKFLYNKCPMRDCKNSRESANLDAVENHVQSMVDYEWDRINS